MRSLLLLFMLCAGLSAKAQVICNPNGNLVIFTNYDGGTLNINVDVNIPNLKIGVCTYEAVTINLTGPYVSNVTEVKYAGYNSANNGNCGSPTIATTTINGAPTTATTSILFAPASPVTNANGNPSIICGYSCPTNVNQGGCNTIDQIEGYFLSQFPGSTLRMHKVQYGCWTSAAENISVGGTCCFNVTTTPLTASIAPTNVTCFGACNGSATAAGSGGTPPYTYQWTTGPATATWGNRCAGVYAVIVSDAAAATATASVTINQPAPKATTLNTVACDTVSFNNMMLTASGTYKDTLTAFNGCDSVVTLNLTYNGANMNVSQSGSTLTAAATGASYQWVDCDSNMQVIGWATSAVFTPIKTGSYAVVVSGNGCTDTSVCKYVVVSGIEETEQSLFKLYPNPAGEEVTVEVSSTLRGKSFTITDKLGRTVARGVLKDIKNRVSLKVLPAGMYIMQIDGMSEGIKVEKH